MINLTKGATETIYFTGTELATISNPYFLFIFTHRVTGEQVIFNVTNTSTTARYDKFSLVVNSKFANSTDGYFSYIVIEKATSTDTDTTGTIVEQGYMVLNPSVPFAPVEYSEQVNTFITYDEQ